MAALCGVYYTWDEDHGGQPDVGFIAEEVGEVLPEIVAYEENGMDAKGLEILPLISNYPPKSVLLTSKNLLNLHPAALKILQQY